MAYTPEEIAAAMQQAAREEILAHFPQFIHDMMCHCEEANLDGASAVLYMADWGVRDAFDAAYTKWLTED